MLNVNNVRTDNNLVAILTRTEAIHLVMKHLETYGNEVPLEISYKRGNGNDVIMPENKIPNCYLCKTGIVSSDAITFMHDIANTCESIINSAEFINASTMLVQFKTGKEFLYNIKRRPLQQIVPSRLPYGYVVNDNYSSKENVEMVSLYNKIVNEIQNTTSKFFDAEDGFLWKLEKEKAYDTLRQIDPSGENKEMFDCLYEYAVDAYENADAKMDFCTVMERFVEIAEKMTFFTKK